MAEPKPPPPKCVKCSEPTELLTILPKLGEHPSFHIRRCVKCGYVNWFAQPDT
jgi:hypothetical protein